MDSKRFAILALAALSLGFVSCSRHAGYRFYPASQYFRATHPAGVELLRGEPRQAHVQLGEVWIRPNPRMSRAHVETKLRKKAARMGADALVIVEDKYLGDRVAARRRRGMIVYRERVIIGVAIRFR